MTAIMQLTRRLRTPRCHGERQGEITRADNVAKYEKSREGDNVLLGLTTVAFTQI